MKADLTERATKQLQAVSNFEASMGSAMQELMVRETAAGFREKFPTDAGMQDKAFLAAIKGIGGQQLKLEDDPVALHFSTSLASVSGADMMKTKGDPKGSLAERIAYAQQMKDLEFQQTFMVTPAEAGEVKG